MSPYHLPPTARVYVILSDSDELVQVRIIPGIIRARIVTTEDDGDGSTIETVLYDVEPDGNAKMRMRVKASDVVEMYDGLSSDRMSIGAAVQAALEAQRPQPPDTKTISPSATATPGDVEF